MHDVTENVHETEAVVPAKRISWGAVIAGVIVVFIIQITLSILGLAIGLTTLDPAREGAPSSAFAIGAAIWWIVTTLLALFAGGWAAARLSGVWTRTSGLLHGIVTWGLVELIFIFMLTSAIGTIIGGAFNIVQSSMAAVPQVFSQLTQLSGNGNGNGDMVNIQWQEIQKEAKELLRQTGQKELSPEQLKKEGQKAQETMEQAASEAMRQPQQAYEEIMQAMDKLLRQGKGVISEVDREAAVNVIVKRTDMSREEAEKVVDRWIRTYQQVSQQAQQTFEQLQEEAVETAEQVGAEAADVGAQASWWSFAMLVLGGGAAGIGGAVGTPKYVRAVRDSTTIQ